MQRFSRTASPGQGEAAMRVVLVIPLFNPDEAAWGRIITQSALVDHTVVVDDSPEESPNAGARAKAEGAGMTYLANPQNLGIAAALNRGISYAASHWPGCAVLTLDQDSSVADTFVRTATALLGESRGMWLILVPQFVAGEAQQCLRFGQLRGEPMEPIQSGMVFSTRLFDRLGGFDEALVIDGVDTDFVLRARNLGVGITAVEGAVLQHSLGRERRVIWGPWSFGSAWHSPQRRYFITRNRLALFRDFGLSHPEWLLRKAYAEAKEAAKALLIGPGRRNQAKAMLAGIRAFRHGVTGPAPPHIRRLSE